MWAADHQIRACEYSPFQFPLPSRVLCCKSRPHTPTLQSHIHPPPTAFLFSMFFLARSLGFPLPTVPGNFHIRLFAPPLQHIHPCQSKLSVRPWLKPQECVPSPLSAHSSVCFSPHRFPDHRVISDPEVSPTTPLMDKYSPHVPISLQTLGWGPALPPVIAQIYRLSFCFFLSNCYGVYPDSPTYRWSPGSHATRMTAASPEATTLTIFIRLERAPLRAH